MYHMKVITMILVVLNLIKDNWKWLLSGDRVYFAYIPDCDSNNYVGYVTYLWSEVYDEYECSILIEYKYRKLGYGTDALNEYMKMS